MRCFSLISLLLGAGPLLLPALAPAQLQRQANTTLTLPASLPSTASYTTTDALGLTFSLPIAVRSQPGVTNRLFVVERNGTIQLVNLAASPNTKTLFLDLAAYLNPATPTPQQPKTPLQTDNENGLLSMEFHPNYAQNGFFFVFYSLAINGQLHQRVARFKVSGDPTLATSVDTTTHQPLITQLDRYGNHNGGDLHFGPADGYLYASVGDEGDHDDTGDNARHINKNFFGAILRIDVDKKPGNLEPNTHPAIALDPQGKAYYSVPVDNPFIGATSHHHETFAASTVRTEIWATGLRNPFRFSFDQLTGRLFVGDVGQAHYEEVDILTAGCDAGWSVYEANHHGPNYDSTLPVSSFLFPIYEYGHSASDSPNLTSGFLGNVITGGVVSRGSRLTELYENYVFCDEGSGHIWALQPTLQSDGTTTWAVKKLGDNGGIVAFGTDPRDGDVLLCDIGQGKIKHLVRGTQSGAPPPATLSATGAFSDLASLTPAAGVVPYDVNVPFWSDGAIKQRWFAIKNTTDTMAFNADGNWTFPTGEVWVKHFNLPLDRRNPTGPSRRIETRFIVKTADDIYGLSYQWNAAGTDADLVAETGADAAYTVTDTGGQSVQQVWHYPSRSECRTCHTPVGGYALSFNTRQINRAHAYGSQTQNQVSALSAAGYLNATVSGVNNLPAFAAAGDTTKSLEHRVRSYLAVNCVQCHQPGGAALGNWDARPTTLTDAAGLINGPLNDNGGDSANRVLVPGDTTHSMLLKRIQGNGVPRMPPLATNLRDTADENLVTAWITDAANGLPARQSFAEWQVAKFGSTTAANAQPGADPDGDGLTNQQEFLLKTDPLSAASRWSLTLAPVNNTLTLSFPQPAGRASVVETSLDLKTWSLWDVPGNTPDYPAAAATRTFAVPAGSPFQFFRVRVLQE